MTTSLKQTNGIARNWESIALDCARGCIAPSTAVAMLSADLERAFATRNAGAFRSKRNWEFVSKPRFTASHDPRIQRLEKCLEKQIASVSKTHAPLSWANQVPASSGLAKPHGATGAENIDLVRKVSKRSCQFIELKLARKYTGSKTTPAYAAIELAKYAVLYVLTKRRWLDKQLPHLQQDLLSATDTTWCVLAPAAFYDRPKRYGIDLGAFAREMKNALRALSESRIGLRRVEFRFCKFPKEFDPKTEREILDFDGKALLEMVERALDGHA